MHRDARNAIIYSVLCIMMREMRLFIALYASRCTKCYYLYHFMHHDARNAIIYSTLQMYTNFAIKNIIFCYQNNILLSKIIFLLSKNTIFAIKNNISCIKNTIFAIQNTTFELKNNIFVIKNNIFAIKHTRNIYRKKNNSKKTQTCNCNYIIIPPRIFPAR